MFTKERLESWIIDLTVVIFGLEFDLIKETNDEKIEQINRLVISMKDLKDNLNKMYTTITSDRSI